MNKLLKLVGRYRVLPELDQHGDFPRDKEGGIDESFNDLYIKCRNDIKIMDADGKKYLFLYSQGVGTINNLLKFLYGEKISKKIPSRNATVYKHLEDKGIVRNITILDGEGAFEFKVKDLDMLAGNIKPMTKGKDIKPFSIKNKRR